MRRNGNIKWFHCIGQAQNMRTFVRRHSLCNVSSSQPKSLQCCFRKMKAIYPIWFCAKCIGTTPSQWKKTKRNTRDLKGASTKWQTCNEETHTQDRHTVSHGPPWSSTSSSKSVSVPLDPYTLSTVSTLQHKEKQCLKSGCTKKRQGCFSLHQDLFLYEKIPRNKCKKYYSSISHLRGW